MRIISQRTLIREVSARWGRQYGPDRAGIADKHTIGALLRALDKETATPAEVEAIIGNASWTEVPSCLECEAAAKEAAGEDYDYATIPHDVVVRLAFDEYALHLCLPCLEKALELARRAAT